MRTRLEVFFDLKADSTVIVSDFTQGSNISNWTYLVDQEAKTITFKTGEKILRYSYTLKDNKLRFVDKESKLKIDLLRQDD